MDDIFEDKRMQVEMFPEPFDGLDIIDADDIDFLSVDFVSVSV